ncbi:hypothetical protein IF2G_02609 [Cordyceps javanica]|nr:hypothetical protein IF2G_02609 [Cordyceps javanica]
MINGPPDDRPPAASGQLPATGQLGNCKHQALNIIHIQTPLNIHHHVSESHQIPCLEATRNSSPNMPNRSNVKLSSLAAHHGSGSPHTPLSLHCTVHTAPDQVLQHTRSCQGQDPVAAALRPEFRALNSAFCCRFCAEA